MNKPNTDFEDSLFKASMRIIAQSLLDECDDFVNECKKEEINIPDSLPKKIRKTINKEKMIHIRSIVYKASKSVAVAVMIFATLFMVACASIKPLRENIYNAIVTWYEEYFTFAFAEEPEKITDVKEVEFKYLPDGYAIASDVTAGNYREVLIENGEHLISYVQRPYDKNGDMLDNHLTTFMEIEINNRNVIYIDDNGNNNIFTWVENGYWHMIDSDIEYTEIIKVIENLN